jgi:Ca-activated chloride channel family protein
MRRVIASSVDEIDAGGQTALCGGLEKGVAQAINASCGTNLVLIVSDGQANVGETDVEAIGRRALDGRLQGVTVSALGIGLDYNEALMAEIALDGGGRFYHVEHDRQLAAYLTGELGEMSSLAARGVSVTVDLPMGSILSTLSAAYLVQGNCVTLGDIPLSTTLEVILKVGLPAQSAGVKLPIACTLRYQSPRGRMFQVALNRVTVRYDQREQFVLAAGAVKPVVRRVLEQMQAAGVLATSKAATRGCQAAREESQVQIKMLRNYAALLGKDPESGELVSESERVFDELIAPAPGAKSKAATQEAMHVQRGSKNFGV